jgi:hypothetical protein
MDFPDMRSLTEAARLWKFREPGDGENEAEYRTALADFVQSHDFIESEETRNGVGWDQFNDGQKLALLQRRMGLL